MSVTDSLLLTILSNLVTARYPNVRVNFKGTHKLVCENITEEELASFTSVTNDPVANATLHLENVEVYLDGQQYAPEPEYVPGFASLMIMQYNNADNQALTNNPFQKTFQPFTGKPFVSISGDIGPNELADLLTSTTQYTTKLLGKRKIYTLTFTNATAGAWRTGALPGGVAGNATLPTTGLDWAGSVAAPRFNAGYGSNFAARPLSNIYVAGPGNFGW
jgi:hypothetical protein